MSGNGDGGVRGRSGAACDGGAEPRRTKGKGEMVLRTARRSGAASEGGAEPLKTKKTALNGLGPITIERQRRSERGCA
jgi:hypothetical protein